VGPTRREVVDAARCWIGTPFHHQGRLRGVGCDCGGLVGGVAVDCGIVGRDFWTRVFDPAFGGYGAVPRRGSLTTVLARFLLPIDVDAAGIGDVLAMRFPELPAEDHHVGIVADYVHGGHSMIHAMSRAPARVTEHRLAPPWRGRVAGAYRFPGLQE
jgi:NlpC/P60 family putative phage cell wall peptidase